MKNAATGSKGRRGVLGTKIVTTSATEVEHHAASPAVIKLECAMLSQLHVVPCHQYRIVSVPANVVPLRPTASGSFTKGASATGSLVFPDLGAGLWILNTSASGLLYLDQVKISSDDKRIRAANARSVTFVADIRPNITVGNANAATIEYVFYSMKVVT